MSLTLDVVQNLQQRPFFLRLSMLCFRQGYEDPHWQYPAAGYGDNYTYQSRQWQPVAWQDDKGMSLSFGSGDGGNLLAEEAMLSPG